MQRISYLFLRTLSGVQYWMRRRLTVAGRFALVCLVISAAVGIDTDLTLAYQVFTFLVALSLLSLLYSLVFRKHFSATRNLPPFVTVGEAFRYRTTVVNLNADTLENLTLLETFTDPRPSYQQFRLSPANAPGRPRGVYRRWRALVAGNRNGRIPEQTLPRLLPQREVEISTEMVPEHRGYIDFAAITIARLDPMGIFKAFATIPNRQSLMVLPKRYDLPDLRLPGTRVYQHGGVTMAASKGDSEEFVGLRDYRPGDPLQQIHWKSFARAGKPVVKEYQDEFFERHALVLDTFTPAGSNEVFEEAVSLAASFACTVETQENLLDLMFVGDRAYTFTAGVGQLHTEGMLEILAGVNACEDKPFDQLHQAVLERRPSLSGCILILLEWDDARRRMVDELTATELPLAVFLVTGAANDIREHEPWLHVLRVGEIEEGLAKL